MIADDFQNHLPVVTTSTANSVELPPGSIIQQIRFEQQPRPEPANLYVYTQPLPFAVQEIPAGSVPSAVLTLVKIPADYHVQPFPLEIVQNWIEQQNFGTPEQPLQVLTFQGTQLVWSDRCLVIMSAAETIELVTRSAIENFYYLRELSRIEQELQNLWPACETDLPLAFEFRERELHQRPDLKVRYEATQLLQSRVVRMSALVNRPYVYPPTLASQIGERVRERMQMVHRHECLADQLEILASIYEQCSQRASDYVLARSGNQLEWIIIVLLIAQLILSGFEMLTSIESTTAEPIATETVIDAVSVN